MTCGSLDLRVPSAGRLRSSVSTSATGIVRTKFARTRPASHLPIALVLYNSFVFFPPRTSVTFLFFYRVDNWLRVGRWRL